MFTPNSFNLQTEFMVLRRPSVSGQFAVKLQNHDVSLAIISCGYLLIGLFSVTLSTKRLHLYTIHNYMYTYQTVIYTNKYFGNETGNLYFVFYNQD